jgi:hypothetical protein
MSASTGGTRNRAPRWRTAYISKAKGDANPQNYICIFRESEN